MRATLGLGLAILTAATVMGCGDDVTPGGADFTVAGDKAVGGGGDMTVLPGADLTVPPGADLTVLPGADLTGVTIMDDMVVVAGADLTGVAPEDLTVVPTCSDGAKNGTETDVDCGGGGCDPCGDGKTCMGPGDCGSGICTGGACATPKCDDKVKNGNESDVDCGGSCSPCAKDKVCTGGADCASGVCTSGKCVDATCTDKVKNGTETDVDCGGSCPKCEAGKACAVAGDCVGMVCAMNVCSSASCSDGAKNGTETDTDCGGGTCPTCDKGKACSKNSDCTTGNCAGGKCAAPACADLNCDGWPDLLFTNYYMGSSYEQKSYLYYHRGQGATPVYSPTAPARIDLPNHGGYKALVEDLNGDGFLDVVFADHASSSTNYKTDSLVYWGAAGGYSATNSQALPTMRAVDVKAGDFNGDGYKDLVFANHQESSSLYVTNSYIYWGSKTGFMATNRALLPTTGALAVEVADLNGDGKLDIVFANSRDNSIATVDSHIYWNKNGSFSTTDRTALPTVGTYGVQIADLNNDGKKDIVFGSYQNLVSGSTAARYSGTGYVYWGSNTGYSTGSRTAFPTIGSQGFALADLDGDKKLEIIVANYYKYNTYKLDSYIYWGANNYDAAKRSEILTYGAIRVAVGDVNNDKRPDVVFANYRTDSTYSTNSFIYWNTSSGFTDTNVAGLATTGARDVKIADLNKDGFNDIVFASYNNGAASTNSFVYWGSASGFSTGNRLALPTAGAIEVLVIQ